MPDSTNYGQYQSYERNQLTPGLPLLAYTVTFKYTKSYQTQPTIRLAVSEPDVVEHPEPIPEPPAPAMVPARRPEPP